MKLFGLISACVLTVGSTIAGAQQPTSEQMISGLLPGAQPGPLTRSWKLRGVKVEGGQTIYGPPSIDLAINFAYNSDKLLTDSVITLDNLTVALKDPRLSKSNFLIGGHADAKGPDQYNLRLSERRALTVKRYLEEHGIDSKRLIDKGYGESELVNPARPEDGINRRVEVVNLSAGS